MRFPVGVAEFVRDEFVGGRLVRNAQQCLGHTHQQHAFLAGKIVFAHERFDRALLIDLAANARDQFGGACQHEFALRRGQAGLRQQLVNDFGLVATICRSHVRGDAIRREGQFWGDDTGVHESLGNARRRATTGLQVPARDAKSGSVVSAKVRANSRCCRSI